MKLRLPVFTVVAMCLVTGAAYGQLRGHGAPVRAVAVSPDGQHAISGGFDSAAIWWSLKNSSAEQVLRFHASAVNAAVFLANGRAASGGADGRIAIWRAGAKEPERVLEGHEGPVAALAVSPDGKLLASSAWDGTVRVWPISGGEPRIFKARGQNINGVAFSPDGRALVSASYDLTLQIWSLGGASELSITLPSPLNAVAVAPNGEIMAGGADGKVYFVGTEGTVRGSVQAGETPIISLASSPDGKLAAAAGIRGSVTLIDRAVRKVVRTLVGPGLPVWSVTFFPDSRKILTGGADHLVRAWDVATGEPVGAIAAGTPADPLAAYAGDRGAEVFRACIACHALSKNDGPRAGPTLAGVFGRRIGTEPGYNFSEALRKMNIVWNAETIAKLFEVGPEAYTPGTKMPEQRIGSAEDRKALTDFLARATRK